MGIYSYGSYQLLLNEYYRELKKAASAETKEKLRVCERALFLASQLGSPAREEQFVESIIALKQNTTNTRRRRFRCH